MAKKLSPHPEWATKYRRPGTEPCCINGRYSLYEFHCIYDKERNRPYGLDRLEYYVTSMKVID